MFKLITQTVCVFLVGTLALLGAHRLYLRWRDRDLDVEREVRSALQDLREEAEKRMYWPAQNNKSPAGPAEEAQQFPTSRTPVNPRIRSILDRLSDAQEACRKETRQ